MIQSGRGPRAILHRVVADVLHLVENRSVADMNQKILVLVASEALRRRLVARLLEEKQALLGVEVMTAFSLARQLVPAQWALDPGLFDILVRRGAEEKEELRRLLADFEDGFSLCASSCRDLLSAGLSRDNQAACAAALHELSDPSLIPRGEALLDVALDVEEDLRRHQRLLTSGLFHEAATELDNMDVGELRIRHLLIVGFSDAPGRTTHFLAGLIKRLPATLYLDLPPDICAPQSESPGAAFARAFARRLGCSDDDLDSLQPTRSAPGRLSMISAVGSAAEAGEVLKRTAQLLQQGVDPEQVGIVYRTKEACLPELRTQAARLGIPVRVDALPASFHPQNRAARALVELLREGGATSSGTFLDLLEVVHTPLRQFRRIEDVRLFLRTRGGGTLADLTLPQKEEARHLPCVDALEPRENRGWQALRRSIDEDTRSLFEAAVAATLKWHISLPRRDTVPSWCDAVLKLLIQTFPREENSDSNLLAEQVDALRQAHEGLHVPVTGSEFRRLLQSHLRQALEVPGGGRGVAVMSLEKARSLAFSHLFVLGVNRGTFPRLGREDPLLSDPLRLTLQSVLPHLASHQQRPLEETYLFAQLLESAADTTLLWQRADQDGKLQARSPFLDRLQLEGTFSSDDEVPRDVLHAARRDAELGLPVQHLGCATAAALSGDRQALEGALERLFVAHGNSGDGSSPAPEEARALMDVLTALERCPESGGSNSMDPWVGFLGRDALVQPLFVTTLERTARCPWQGFLSRALRLEALPDDLAKDAGIGSREIGLGVHRCLEELLHPAKIKGERPGSDAVHGATLKAAAATLQESHHHLPGLVPVLASLLAPFVERALEIDWRDEAPPVVDVEAAGSFALRLSGERRFPVHYRVDRIDSVDGTSLLTDYKTGRPHSIHKTAAKREQKYREAVESGVLLQAAAYAVGSGGRGRYLYLRPDAEDDCAEFAFDAAEIEDRLHAVGRHLLSSWQQGVMPPRLEQPDGLPNTTCDYCDFKPCCIHGDSGARRRLTAMTQTESDSPEPTVLQNIWNLPEAVARSLEDMS